jgi:hypothetical protein
MKRLLIPVVAFFVVSIFTASCNNYTCPAYADETEQPEQVVEQDC